MPIDSELNIWRKAIPYLVAGDQNAPNMTEHGPWHARRVLKLASATAEIAGATAEEVALLRRAAILHDVGNYDPSSRGHHEQTAEALITQWRQDYSLRLSEEESLIIGALVNAHRGDYDPNRKDTFTDETTIRTGLLSTFLRMADGLDVDFRRSPASGDQLESIKRALFPESTEHHQGVRAIEGVRICWGGSPWIEVLVRDPVAAGIQLWRLQVELQQTPWFCPLHILPIKRQSGLHPLVSDNKGRALVYSYFDAHGIITAFISQSVLTRVGFDVDVRCNYEETRKAHAFWQHSLPNLDTNIKCLVVQNIPLEKDNLEAAIEGIQRIVGSGAEVWYISHSDTALRCATALRHAGAKVVATDPWLSFMGNAVTDEDINWGMVAAAARRDPSVADRASHEPYQSAASDVTGFCFELVADAINGKGNTQERVEKAIAAFRAQGINATKQLPGAQTRLVDMSSLQVKATKHCLVVENDLGMKGRLYYDALEQLMDRAGTIRIGTQPRHRCPFAIARLPNDGVVDVLFMHHWIDPSAIPMQAYVEPHADVLKGFENAIWARCDTKEKADMLIANVVDEINRDN